MQTLLAFPCDTDLRVIDKAQSNRVDQYNKLFCYKSRFTLWRFKLLNIK
jgi:hypothetical protein